MPRFGWPFRNLVFEGGGVKSIARFAALAVLEERGTLRRIKRVGATSTPRPTDAPGQSTWLFASPVVHHEHVLHNRPNQLDKFLVRRVD